MGDNTLNELQNMLNNAIRDRNRLNERIRTFDTAIKSLKERKGDVTDVRTKKLDGLLNTVDWKGDRKKEFEDDINAIIDSMKKEDSFWDKGKLGDTIDFLETAKNTKTNERDRLNNTIQKLNGDIQNYIDQPYYISQSAQALKTGIVMGITEAVRVSADLGES